MLSVGVSAGTPAWSMVEDETESTATVVNVVSVVAASGGEVSSANTKAPIASPTTSAIAAAAPTAIHAVRFGMRSR